MNKSPNVSSRNGWKPDIIVCHITDGAYAGSITWLCNPESHISAHYVVGRNGQMSQLVDLQQAAWCNGTQTGKSGSAQYTGNATAALVKQRKVNANLYTISIECEGFDSTHGILTDVQFSTLVSLIKSIRQQVKSIFGIDIPLDRDHIIGHCEITPREKPNCPGHDFPYDRLIQTVKGLPALTTIDQANENTVRGWALNISGLREVDVYYDGAHGVTSTRSFTARTDVNKLLNSHGGYPDGAHCGYSITIPTDKIPIGKHTLGVAAIGKDGSSKWAYKDITISAPVLPPIAWIDSPADGTKVSTDFTVSGWGVAGEGVERVDIYADGKRGLASIKVLSDRPDVDKTINAHGWYKDALHSGYAVTVPVSALSKGKHIINVAVITKNNTATWAAKSITVI